MTKVNIPDPQHIMLKALEDEVYRLIEAGEDLEWAFNEVPESVVFTSDDLMDYDHEEAMEMVKEVGSRDLDAKIRFWTRVLETHRDSLAEVCKHDTKMDVPCSACYDEENE